MNLVESYSLAAGAKISRPFIYSKYFPLPFLRYVTFHSTSKEAKNYDYWDDVIELIKPELDKAGIAIVQIGAKEDRVIRNTYNICGQTSLNQAAFVIEHGELHLGADSFGSHFAGHYNKPIVCLYSNNYVQCVSPYFGDRSRQVLLEPDRKGAKPNFSFNEQPKTINQIKPEIIAGHVLKLLGLPFDYPFETLFTGENYKNPIIETVPNQVIGIQNLGVPYIHVRMDYEYNEKNLVGQLQNTPCVIITDKPIKEEILKTYKQNIKGVTYIVSSSHEPAFVESLIRHVIPMNLISEDSQEDINKYKLYYMNYAIVHKRKECRKDNIESISNYSPENLYFKTNRFILSKGKIYTSKIHMAEDKSIKTFQENIVQVIDNEEFWRELEYFTILNKK